MKKFFKVLGIAVIVLIAVLAIVPFALRGKIDGIIKSEANDMLNARFDYSKLGISLFRNFPNASLHLKDMSIAGIDEFEGDTLIYAKDIALVVNTMSIFKESGIEIKKIIVNKPSVYAHILKDGKANWDIVKEDPEEEQENNAEESSFKLQIKKFGIKDASIKYLDEEGNMEYSTYPCNAELRGHMYGDVTTLNANVTAQNSYYRLENMPYLNGQSLGLDGIIEADLANSKYSFDKTTLFLNEIKMGLNGNVLLADDYMDFDIAADCKQVNFKDVLSLIPAIYTNDFKNLTVGGDLSMDAWLKGRMQGDNLPAFGLKMNLDNGNFKYAQLPQSVTDIFIDLNVENSGGSADATKIDLSKLSMVMAGNRLNAKLKLYTPISNPDFDAVMNGVIDFAKIKEVYPLPDTINLSGKVTADFAIKGTMSQIEKEQYEQMTAKGTFSVKDFEATVGSMPKILVNSAQANVTPKELIVSGVNILIGNSDIKMDGGVQNYIGYVLKSTQLKGRLNVTSNKLDLNEMFGIDTSQGSGASGTAEVSESSDSTQVAGNGTMENASDTSAILIPKNLDFVLTTALNEVLMNKIVLKDLVGKITVKDGEAILDNLKMNAFDGKLDVSGLYSSKDATRPLANLDLSFKDASFKTTFNQLDVIKKLVPLFEKTGGNYSMDMNLSTALSSNLSPVIPTLNAQGKLTTSNINIQNVKAFSAISTLLKDDNLKEWQIKDAVVVKFTIKDGKVNTNPFDVKMGNIKLNLSGLTSLDSEIDYLAKVTLPDNKFLNSANVRIGGTFANPKVSLDVKDAAASLISNIVGDKKLPGGLDTLSISETVQKKIEDLRNAAISAGDKLVETAEKQKQALIDKATGDIGKLAAEKAGEKLVNAAKKERQKLLDKANEEIDKLKQKTE